MDRSRFLASSTTRFLHVIYGRSSFKLTLFMSLSFSFNFIIYNLVHSISIKVCRLLNCPLAARTGHHDSIPAIPDRSTSCISSVPRHPFMLTTYKVSPQEIFTVNSRRLHENFFIHSQLSSVETRFNLVALLSIHQREFPLDYFLPFVTLSENMQEELLLYYLESPHLHSIIFPLH